jgi:hypothetical protein
VDCGLRINGSSRFAALFLIRNSQFAIRNHFTGPLLRRNTADYD